MGKEDDKSTFSFLDDSLVACIKSLRNRNIIYFDLINKPLCYPKEVTRDTKRLT